MKNILFIFLLFTIGVKAQSHLPQVSLSENITVHLISPEPIQYVDISSRDIVGDLPLKNVLRIKLKDSVKKVDAVITIAGEKFISQFHVVTAEGDLPTEINILPDQTTPLDIVGIGFSQNQLKHLSMVLAAHKPEKRMAHVNAFGIKAQINHIYTAGDYLFVDLAYKNTTNLSYDINEFSFKLEDKKIVKATNVQSFELKPEFVLFDNSSFKRYYRNIFVFKKVSFPGDKMLNIEMNEKQVSGRVIKLGVTYRDVLSADIIPAD